MLCTTDLWIWKKGDIFLGISTSGNSKNILYAAITARAKGLKVIGLTGKKIVNYLQYLMFAFKFLAKKHI